MTLESKKLPIEFLPGFWVTCIEGLQGKGSGFLLAENIRAVFTVDIEVAESRDANRFWTILKISKNEIAKNSYLSALVRIISESWIETGSIILLGDGGDIRKILQCFLEIIAGTSGNVSQKILRSKLG
jgi:hypothetical protein